MQHSNPSWKGYLDSVPVQIGKGPDGFLSIPVNVPAGSHELKLVFTTDVRYVIFGLLSVLFWLGVVALLLVPSVCSGLETRTRKYLY